MTEQEKNRAKYPTTAEIVDKIRVVFPDATVKSTTEKPKQRIAESLRG